MDESHKRKLPRERWHADKEKYNYNPRRVTVTDELRADLDAVFRNSELNSRKLLVLSGAPVGLTPNKVADIIAGKRKTILETHAEFLRKLASVSIEPSPRASRAARPTRTPPTSQPNSRLLPVPREWREKISNEIARTGVRPDDLVRISDPAPDFKSATMKNWLSGRTKHAYPHRLQWVTDAYAALCDNYGQTDAFLKERPTIRPIPKYRKPIPAEMIEAIRHEIERTGVQPIYMIRTVAPEERIKGISGASIRNWLRKKTASTRPEYLQWVIDHYERLPTRNP